MKDFTGYPGVVIGTGPSLAAVADDLRYFRSQDKIRLFGINNTFNDFDLDCWIACDPAWHDFYGKIEIDCDQWHWREEICEKFGYKHIPGEWLPGLSTDRAKISFGHSSGWQALNLALHYGCNPLILVGYDMTYRENEPRHYFDGLSDAVGEYPQPIRKHSLFDKPDKTGLLYDYKNIADQVDRGELPPIINCTPGSAMRWFPIMALQDALECQTIC